MYRLTLTSKILGDSVTYEAETETEMSDKIQAFINANGTFFAGMYESNVEIIKE